MRRYLLKLITRLTIEAPILVLSACAVITVIAAVAGLRLFPVRTDLLRLLPETASEALTYQRAVNQFGSFDYLLAVVESPQPNQPEPLIEVATRFADAVRRFGSDVQSIEYAPDPEKREDASTEIPERLIPALLTNAELEEMQRRLQSGLDEHMRRMRARLIRPLSPERRQALLRDPLGLEEMFRRNRSTPRGPIRGPIRGGLLISEDSRMLVMVLKPRRPATDLMFTEQLMNWLRVEAQSAVTSSGPSAASIRISFIGSHAEAENDAPIIRSDLALTLIASFVLVVFLFIVAMRRFSAIFFVGIPLATGIIWTLGVADFFFDHLSIVTCIFGAALVGLGIDYAIHIYNRYLEERLSGAEVPAALETALCETGQGVLVAALTTAVGFYGMYFTWFEGLQELAIVGGSGILCCLAAMLFVLPPLVVLSERAPARLKLRTAPRTLGLGRLATTIQIYPHLTLTVGLIVTAYLSYFAERIGFDDDVRHLHELPANYEDLGRLAENRGFQLPSGQLIAMVSAPNMEEGLQLNDRLYQRLEDCAASFPLLGYDSLRTVLPSVRTQRDTQKRVRDLLDLNALQGHLRDVGKKWNLSATATGSLLNQLRRWKEAATDSNLVRLGDTSSPEFVQLITQYVNSARHRCRVVTHIFPRQGEWENQVPEDFVVYLQGNNKALKITGLPFVTDALRRLLRDNMVWAVILVASWVFLLLMFHFRSARKAAVATIPVLCGLVWTLGTMQLLGMHLDLLNILVIPMILGLGINSAIHVFQRYYEDGQRDLESAVEQSGRAIMVTSLATLVAFGTMSLATFRAIREVGIVAMMGVGFTLIASIFLLPALLRLAGGRLRLIDLLGGDEEDRPNGR